MKKAALLLLLATTLVFAYSSHSFRHLSTSGILWDNYDWFTTDPARIPLIEGSELYTNLANFVNSAETGLSDSSWMPGSYLIGGKMSGNPLAFAGVADVNMVRIADPTGVGQTMGHSATADTSYQVDPTDGSIIGRTYGTQTVDAYHTDSDLGGYFGLGYASSETFSLGFAFEHRTDNTFEYAPLENRTESNRTYDIDNALTSYDSLYSFGKLGSKQMTNALKFGTWMDMDGLEISAYLGADILTGNSDLDTVYSYDLDDPTGTAITSSYDNEVTSWPYFGLTIPLEVLGIYEIYEGSELWFSGGVEYLMMNWKDSSGAKTVATDTSLADGAEGTETTISENTTLTTGSGKSSGISFNLGVKGVFDLSEKVSFGLGARLLGSTGKDSLHNDNVNSSYSYFDDGDGIGKATDVTTTVESANTDYVLNKRFSIGFNLPVGVEFKPWAPVALRLGAIFSYMMDTYTSHTQGVGTQSTVTTVERGDGTSDITTSYSPYSISNSEGVRAETSNNLVYNYGVGFAVTENFQLDLMGFTNLLDMTNWRFSAIFRF